MPDHVHLLLDVDPRIGIDKIKRNTADTIGKEYRWMQSSSTSRHKKANDRVQGMQVPYLSKQKTASRPGCSVWTCPLHLQLGCATRSLETDAKSGDERQGYCTLTTECSCKRKTCPSSGEVKAPSPGVRLVNAGQKREGKAVDCKPMR